MVTTMTEGAVAGPPSPVTILQATEMEHLPPERLDGIAGVFRRVMWREGSAESGVLTVGKGVRMGVHAHRHSHHHIWVLSGSADVLGTRITSGAYVHIGPGVEHEVDASQTDGCTLLYVYAPHT